jgi:hypothetical protein
MQSNNVHVEWIENAENKCQRHQNGKINTIVVCIINLKSKVVRENVCGLLRWVRVDLVFMVQWCKQQ